MNISGKIEHTLLAPGTTESDIRRIAEEALKYKFVGVCIPPYFVRDLYRHTETSNLKIITVAGFPMGYSSTVVKNEELRRALDEGASAVDAVINIAAVKSDDWPYVASEIETLTRSAHLKGKEIKLILETGILTPEELEKLVGLGLASGVDYFKTSTGFGGLEGATPETIAHLRTLVKNNAKLKASGGIRTADQVKALLDAGADTIGTSASIDIINALRS
jgi:deoxyribose-phosphate aldolase